MPTLTHTKRDVFICQDFEFSIQRPINGQEEAQVVG
jgi:hypothetical protein